MFYDLEDPNRFVADIKKVMHPDGLWIVQMSYLLLMLKTNDFGNICHEHLEYYSLQSFEYLLNLHDFVLVDVELNDVNGGSFRAYIRNRTPMKVCSAANLIAAKHSIEYRRLERKKRRWGSIRSNLI